MNHSLDMQCKFFYYTTGLGCSVHTPQGEWLEGFGTPQVSEPMLRFQPTWLPFPFADQTIRLFDLPNGLTVLLSVHGELHYLSAPFILGDHSMSQHERIVAINAIPQKNCHNFLLALRSFPALNTTRSFFMLTLLQHLPSFTIKEFDLIAYEQAEQASVFFDPNQIKQEDIPLHDMEKESQMMAAIEHGDTALAESIYRENVQHQRFTKLGDSVLRSLKNNAIVFSTLCARAAVRGGASSEAALSLADIQIQKIESCYEIETLLSLNLKYAVQFAQLVQQSWDEGERMKAFVRKTILEHPNQRITRHELADLSNLTPTYYSRKFTETTGLRLHDWIESIRMENAIHLLRYSNLSILEISIDCGFASQSHFTQRLREKTGKTPAAYRTGI